MRLLTPQERKEIEVPREIYVNIKMLEVIEKTYTFEKISENDYQSRLDTILKRIDKLKMILQSKNPNFTLDMFIQEYGLQDCTWAIQRIKKGKPQENSNSNSNMGLLIAGITSSFIRISDHLVINEDSSTVRQVLPMIEEMKQLMDKIKPHFNKPTNPFNLGDIYQPTINKLNQLDLGSILSKELVNDILDTNEFVKKKFENYLSSQ
mmetsp:Transcript_34932/g.31470  ORF Transcript_34932/g.31470 Transcript_34932/m.31470 type:complete len:207 (+) Transcript_34932:250-870(+)